MRAKTRLVSLPRRALRAARRASNCLARKRAQPARDEVAIRNRAQRGATVSLAASAFGRAFARSHPRLERASARAVFSLTRSAPSGAGANVRATQRVGATPRVCARVRDRGRPPAGQRALFEPVADLGVCFAQPSVTCPLSQSKRSYAPTLLQPEPDGSCARPRAASLPLTA